MVFIDMFHEFTYFIIFEHKTSEKVPLAVDTMRTYLGNVKVRLESTPLKTSFGRYTLDPKDPQPVWWSQFIRSSNGEYQRSGWSRTARSPRTTGKNRYILAAIHTSLTLIPPRPPRPHPPAHSVRR